MERILILILLPCLNILFFLFKLKEVAMHLMTSLKINANSIAHELGQWAVRNRFSGL